jgi:hypothetical protein
VCSSDLSLPAKRNVQADAVPLMPADNVMLDAATVPPLDSGGLGNGRRHLAAQLKTALYGVVDQCNRFLNLVSGNWLLCHGTLAGVGKLFQASRPCLQGFASGFVHLD